MSLHEQLFFIIEFACFGYLLFVYDTFGKQRYIQPVPNSSVLKSIFKK